MQSTRFRRGWALLATAPLLLVGLAGNGGAETAPGAPSQAVEVALGASGDSITLMPTEAGGFTLDGEAVESGREVTATNGNVYVLTLADGAVAAAYRPVERTVELGLSGESVTLERAEDGSWSLAGTPVASGHTHTAGNGNAYILALAGGDAWTAAYSPRTLAIANTGLTATAKEDGSGYTVGEAGELAGDGSGSLDADGALYRVWRDAAGSLQGLRYDRAIGRSTDAASGTDKRRVGLAAPALGGDAEGTPQDETGAELTVGGGLPVALADLFAEGSAAADGQGLVAAAVEAIGRQRAVVVALYAADEADDSIVGSDVYDHVWASVQDALDELFGASHVALGIAPTRARMLGEIDAVLGFLASEAGFVAGTARGGAYENSRSGWDEDAARTLFHAIGQRETVRFGFTANTRFGARTLEVADANDPGELHAAERNVFAYSPLEQTLRVRDLPSTGMAVYRGRTVAVDEDAGFYAGDIELHLSLASRRIEGAVSGLVGDDGSPWTHGGAAVEWIHLPRESLGGASGSSPPQWSTGTASQTASLIYSNKRPSEVAAYWQGELLGRGAEAGTAAIGSWSLSAAAVAADNTDFEDSFLLRGAFGAEQPTVGAEQPRSEANVLQEAATWVATPVLPGLAGGDQEGLYALLSGLGSGGPIGLVGGSLPEYAGTAADLFGSGAATFAKEPFAIAFRDVLARQLEVLRTALAAEEAGADLTATKATIWATLRGGAAELFPAAAVTEIFGAQYPDRDRDAIGTLEGALAALQDRDSFAAAVDPGGGGPFALAYYDADGDLRDGVGLVGAAAWDNGGAEIEARYGAVGPTHFGAWSRRTATAAYERRSYPAAGAAPFGVFAYSPLGTARVDYDDVANLTATYVGEAWLAEYIGGTWESTTAASRNANLYAAIAEVVVTWGAARTDGGTYALAISDIADGGGNLLNAAGWIPNEPDEFSGIVLRGEIFLDSDGNAVTTADDPTVELTSVGNEILAGKAKVFPTEYVDLRFVADSDDGPLGVLGMFELEDGGYQLHGAFGAERTSVGAEQPPSESNVLQEAATWVATPVLPGLAGGDREGFHALLSGLGSGGPIGLVGGSLPEYAGTAADLFGSGAATFAKEPFAIAFRDVLARQLAVLRNVLAAEEAGADLTATKATIWATLRGGAAELFPAAAVTEIFGAQYPDRDRDAIRTIEGAIEALQDRDSFAAAVDPGGGGRFALAYYDADGDLRDGVGLVGAEAWDNGGAEIEARYGAVGPTHFGAWSRRTATAAYERRSYPAAGASPFGVFAYSPLGTARVDYDDVANLTATYVGEAWLAEYIGGTWESTTAASRNANLYEAIAEVVVTWGAARVDRWGVTRTDSGTYVLAISDIADGDGDRLNEAGWLPNESGEFSGIVLRGEIFVDSDGNAITRTDDPTVELSSAATLARKTKVFPTEYVDLRFVADSYDGPLGVLGRFVLEDGGYQLHGAFGAEQTSVGEEQPPPDFLREAATWVATPVLPGLAPEDQRGYYALLSGLGSGGPIRLLSGSLPDYYLGTAADLFGSGAATFKRVSFAIAVRNALERQLEVLTKALAAEAAGANIAGIRRNVWRTVQTEALYVFPGLGPDGAVTKIFGKWYPSTDQDAIQLLEGAIEALQDRDSFVAAVDPNGGGPFALAPAHYDAAEAWDIRRDEIEARYTQVGHTHFGAWNRRTATSAYDRMSYPAAEASPFGVFAYSPLGTARVDYDDVANLTATYGGEAWLAEYIGGTWKSTTPASRNANLYEAISEVVVTWGAARADGGTYVLSISDIADGGGNLLNAAGWIPNESGEFSGIVLRGEISVDRDGNASTRAGDPTVELTSVSNEILTGKAKVFPTEYVNLRFVADSDEGPLGVLGMFELKEGGYQLHGAFGAARTSIVGP